MFMPFYDPLYLLVAAVGAAIALFAQFRVKSAFARYARVPTRAGTKAPSGRSSRRGT